MRKYFIVIMIFISVASGFLRISNALDPNNIHKKYERAQLLNCQSIEVDSHGKIYLSDNYKDFRGFYVFEEDGTFLYLLQVDTDDGIRIFINEYDELFIAFSQMEIILVLDNEGNYLYEMESNNSLNFRKFDVNIQQAVMSDGAVYKIEKFLGYYIISKEVGGEKRRLFSISKEDWGLKAFTSITTLMIISMVISIIIIFMVWQNSKYKDKKLGLSYFLNYLWWIINIRTYKSNKSFGNQYIEINFYRNEFWRKAITYFWLLLFITLNFSHIAKVGFSDKGYEYNVVILFTIITFLLLNLSIVLVRLYIGKFMRRSEVPDKCFKCNQGESDIWTFSMNIYGKTKCNICNRVYKEMFEYQRIVRMIISGIITILFTLMIYSLIRHIEIGFRIALTSGWAIAAWHFFNVIVNAIGYKKTIIEEYQK